MLKYLSRHHDITLIAFLQPEDDKNQVAGISTFCKRIEMVPLNIKPGNSFIKTFAQLALNFILLKPYILSKYYSATMTARIQDVVSKDKFDIVLIEYWYLGQYAKYMGDIPKVLDEVDVEYIRHERRFKKETNTLRRQKFKWIWHKIKKWELKLIREFDTILAVTPIDKVVLETELEGLDISIIPTGLDAETLIPSPRPEAIRDLVFMGSYAHYPNVDGIRYFCEEIFPIIIKEVPHVRLSIVGPYVCDEVRFLANDVISVTGFIEDISPLLAKSISIAPLRIGSGIKGKIIEAMGLGSPVVTTSIGAEGLYVIPGEHLLIDDSPLGFAAKVIELLRNRPLRERLSTNGIRLVKEKYTWSGIIPEMNQIFNKLAYGN